MRDGHVGATYRVGACSPHEKRTCGQLATHYPSGVYPALVFRNAGHLAAGRYKVAWKTAATDGHPSQGSFTFVVPPTAIPAAAPPSAAPSVALTPAAGARHDIAEDSAMQPPDQQPMDEPTAETLPYVLTRALSFVALLCLIGVIVFHAFVVQRTEVSESDKVRMRASAARLGVYAAAATVLAAGARLYLQAAMMAGADESTSSMIAMTITETEWGRIWIVQVATASVAAIAFVMIGRGLKRVNAAWCLGSFAAIVLAVMPALSGHAAAGRFAAVAVGLDGAHVLAASAWLGTLVCVLLCATGRDEPRRRKGERTKAIVHAFSPVALISATLVVVTGALSAWLRLGSLSAVWTSGYGRVLLLKLATLSAVVGTGAFNWVRVRPTLGTPVATARLRRTVSVELAIGCAVLIITAVLVAMPTPLDVSSP